MNFINKCLLFFLALLFVPCIAFSGIVWEENFDNFPDWEQPYRPRSDGVPIACTAENPSSHYCVDYGLPPGGSFDKFYGWYMSPAEYAPTGHGIHVNSTNKRGSTGKGLTTYSFYHVQNTVAAGGQLAIALPNTTGYEEIYVRFWIQYQPGYVWPSGAGSSPFQKICHIGHYMYNGKPFTFFSSGGFFPLSIPQVGKYNNGVADLHLDFSVRTDPSYLASSRSDYFDIPNDAYPVGNYAGTGTDFGTPGMPGDGNWHCLEFYLKNNSAPGVADGKAKLWLDGNLQQNHSDVMWREAASTLGQGIWNFVHISGNSLLEGTPLGYEEWRAFDDIVIYTPLTSSDPLWSVSPQDGRLPMLADTALPSAPSSLALSNPAASSFNLAWSASTDNVGVAGYRLDVSLNSAFSSFVTGYSNKDLGNVTSASITGLSAGTVYYARLRAYDAAGNVSANSAAVSAATLAAPDTTAPTASITAPAAGAAVSGAVSVSATATDSVGVTKVEFYIDGNLKATDTSSPYSYSLDTTQLANGSHALLAKAYDAAGNVGQSAQVSVTVANAVTDATAPSAPANPALGNPTVSSLNLAWSASTDNVGVAGYRLDVSLNSAFSSLVTGYNNKDLGNVTSASITGLSANTAYYARLRAYDAAGNTSANSAAASARTTVLPDILAPTAAIISPANGANVSGTVVVSAAASDNTGVVKIEFYIDGLLKSTLTSAPYAYSLDASVLALGSHAIMVKAYDAAGNSGTQSITVNVVKPSGKTPPGQAKSRKSFLSPSSATGITFGTEAIKVEIFNMRGKKVFEATGTNGAPITWTGKESGKMVESGAYMARITDSSGAKQHQTIVVVK
ncbi:MAG TPA: hypothetical protein DCP85_12025 [Elusimicrobia bacterium]|nr:hypothetical protein [Elusimicrobiota bacterium]